jgi:hypothetical protein
MKMQRQENLVYILCLPPNSGFEAARFWDREYDDDDDSSQFRVGDGADRGICM